LPTGKEGRGGREGTRKTTGFEKREIEGYGRTLRAVAVLGKKRSATSAGMAITVWNVGGKGRVRQYSAEDWGAAASPPKEREKSVEPAGNKIIDR